MHRTQLLLEEWQYHRLRAEASRRRTSLSGALRAILDEVLGRTDLKAGLKELAGFISDGGRVAEEHDHYLYGEDTREPRTRT